MNKALATDSKYISFNHSTLTASITDILFDRPGSFQVEKRKRDRPLDTGSVQQVSVRLCVEGCVIFRVTKVVPQRAQTGATSCRNLGTEPQARHKRGKR